MNKLKTLGITGAVLLAIASFCLSVFFVSPSDATNGRYRELISSGIIDSVVTPHEIGLDYLGEEPVQIAADRSLLNSIHQAEESASRMPEDIPVLFAGGTNKPIKVSRIPNDSGTPPAASGVDFLGFVDRNGQQRSFTPSNLIPPFVDERQNGGNLSATTLGAQNILVADATNTFLMAKRIPVYDLIVRKGNKIHVVPNVNANAVCRDALNAFLTGSVRRGIRL